MSPEAVLSLIQARYRPQFRSTFDAEPSLELAALPLASYLRTIVDGDSRYDRLCSRGPLRFERSRAADSRCFRVKPGAASAMPTPILQTRSSTIPALLFGLTRPRTSMLIDEGRFAVTQTPVDRGAFKTPVLNACRTAHCSKGGGAALRLVEGGANTLC